MSNHYQVGPQLFAGSSNIPTSVFISMDPNVDFSAVVSPGTTGAVNTLPIGISTNAQDYAPGVGTTNNIAAYYTNPAGQVVQDNIPYYPVGSVALLLAATGGSGWTRGAYIGPNTDGSGQGIPITTSGAAYGAIALSAGVAGAFVQVYVQPGFHP